MVCWCLGCQRVGSTGYCIMLCVSMALAQVQNLFYFALFLPPLVSCTDTASGWSYLFIGTWTACLPQLSIAKALLLFVFFSDRFHIVLLFSHSFSLLLSFLLKGACPYSRVTVFCLFNGQRGSSSTSNLNNHQPV